MDATQGLATAKAAASSAPSLETLLAALGQTLCHNADDCDALLAQAGVMLALNRPDQAAASARRALQLQPQRFEAMVLNGLVAGAQQQHELALRFFDQALALQPQSVPLLLDRGTALSALQRDAEALHCFEQALRFDPTCIDALLKQGALRMRGEQYRKALQCFDAALALQPEHVEVLRQRAAALGTLDDHAGALACAQCILSLSPEDVPALVIRAVALGRMNRFADALASIDAALKLAPDDAEVLDGRGFALARLNRHAEAVQCFDRALALQPQRVQARYNRALVLLAMGRFTEGFRDFESRWDSDALLARSKLRTSAPLWLGDAGLSGKTILLHHEQGFGDTLQFARYVPLVAQRAAHVILRVPEALRELLESLPGGAQIISDQSPLPPHDLHCPLMSLPLALATTVDSIPASIPYLRADAQRHAHWAAELGTRQRPRVGLVWAGRQYPPVDDRRDMPLACLRPLLDQECDFISLQKDIPVRDRALLETIPQIRRCGEGLTSFADTAALIDNLDLVITVDTSVAHLAAALGRPVWIMSRYAGCWRWLLQRDDSPWYPSVRLFRQQALGEWQSVIDAVGRALLQFAKAS